MTTGGCGGSSVMGDLGPGDSSESWAKCDIRIPPLAEHDVGVIVCVHWGQTSPQGGLVGDHSLERERERERERDRSTV